MVRAFQRRLLPSAAVQRLLDNLQRGPSAGYAQGFEFLVLDGYDETVRYWDALDPGRGWAKRGWPGVYEAPLLIVPFSHAGAYAARYAEPDKAFAGRRTLADWTAPHWHTDTAFAAMLALLTAVDLGLGALFFGVRDPAALRAEFGVPDGFEPVGTLAIGYPAPDRRSASLARGRRPAEEVIHRGRWSAPPQPE
jgi:nitroreductase